MNEIDIALGPDTDPAEFIRRNLPEGSFRRIVLKPKWVKHEEHPEFPIAALVTSTALIEACSRARLVMPRHRIGAPSVHA